MTKKEQIMNVLERMGYMPHYDDDGDIQLRYQLKHLFFLVSEDDEDKFVQILLPQFHEFVEGEDTLNLAVCNKLTRDTKMTKVFIDHTLRNISASCEFYYNSDESLEMCISKSLGILGIIRTAFFKCLRELSE